LGRKSLALSSPHDVSGDLHSLTFVQGDKINKHGTADVFEIFDPSPRSALRALGIPEGEHLVVKYGREAKRHTPRREAAIRAIHRLSDTDKAGLVPVLAMGTAELRDGASSNAWEVETQEIMPWAGHNLENWTDRNRGHHKVQLRAMLPAARALLAIHAIDQDSHERGTIMAHRDIKPSNLFVLNPDDDNYAYAIARQPDLDGLPLIRIGDYGLLYAHDPSRLATTTSIGGASLLWSPPEAFPRSANDEGPMVNVPQARDHWCFAAVLFFALTGQHPWTEIEHERHKEKMSPGFSYVDFLIANPVPTSPLFAQLDTRLADAIKGCLAPLNRRHRLDELLPIMEELASKDPWASTAELHKSMPGNDVMADTGTSYPAEVVPEPDLPQPADSAAAIRHNEPRPLPIHPAVHKPGPPRTTGEAQSPRASEPKPLSGLQTAGALGSVAAVVLVLFLLMAFHLLPTKGFPIDLRPTSPDPAPPQTTAASSTSPTTMTESASTPPPLTDDELNKELARAQELARANTVVGIGPWTKAQHDNALVEPLSPTGWAYKWAINAKAPGRDTTSAGFALNRITGTGPVLTRPSFVYELAEIRNSSSRAMTFMLGNCSAQTEIAKSGSGPALLVAAPAHGIYRGYAFDDGTGPHAATPACSNPLTGWRDPITVAAGTTWKADMSILLVFEMPADATPETYKATGFLLKSTEGDIAFASMAPDAGADLQMPEPNN
jgi:serine/threonine protein kinase